MGDDDLIRRGDAYACVMNNFSNSDALDAIDALPAASAEDIGILRARVEDQATEIARLTRIIQMQPPAIRPAEDVRAGALKEALDNKEQLDIWAQEILEGLSFADVLKIESYEDKIEAHSVIGRGIVEVLRALIPEAKP